MVLRRREKSNEGKRFCGKPPVRWNVSLQLHKSCFGMPEAAITVERSQMRLEIDMQPLCSTLSRYICGSNQQCKCSSNFNGMKWCC